MWLVWKSEHGRLWPSKCTDLPSDGHGRSTVEALAVHKLTAEEFGMSLDVLAKLYPARQQHDHR
jgi:hypothetical protein